MGIVNPKTMPVVLSRRSVALATVALSLLPFSSCTCHHDTPEPPPKAAERPIGFGAMVTPRKWAERVEQGEGEMARNAVTPRDVTPPTVPTLPPTPGESSIPDNFPAGIPVPDGAKVADRKSVV